MCSLSESLFDVVMLSIYHTSGSLTSFRALNGLLLRVGPHLPDAACPVPRGVGRKAVKRDLHATGGVLIGGFHSERCASGSGSGGDLNKARVNTLPGTGSRTRVIHGH